MRKLAKKIDVVECQDAALDKIDNIKNTDGVKNIAFLNAHACLMSRKYPRFEKSLVSSDILLRDGIGVKLMLKYLRMTPGYNANGTDLIPLILEKYKENKILCIGTAEPYISKGVSKMRNNDVNVISYMDGFRSNEEMLNEIQETKPEIVLLGMGMPKQELFCEYVKEHYQDQPLLLICGGAIIDFYAERFSRAPKIFRRTGCEWMYRLFAEPKRLFKRYIFGIPYFLFVLVFVTKS